MTVKQVLKQIQLNQNHAPTGKTVHLQENVKISPPSGLQIVSYENDGGYYLLYLDSNGRELADTWHETLEAAQGQAEFEFNVKPQEWRSALQ